MYNEAEQSKPSPETSMTFIDFMMAEYKELRGEILKRTELQHQMLSIALIAFGTFITVSVKIPADTNGQLSSLEVLLAYPILAMCLTAAWAQHDVRIGQIGVYIRERIETRFLPNYVGWEHTHKTQRGNKDVDVLTRFASVGILIGSQVLTITLYIFIKGISSISDIRHTGWIPWFIIADGLCWAISIYLARQRKSSVNKFEGTIKKSNNTQL
jgi:hypothetical protein